MSHRKYGLDHLGCRTARRLVSPALALWLCSQPFAARADLYFNPRFLADDPAAVADLSGFEKGQEVPPGTYRVDIYLNNGFMTTRDVTFQADAQGHGLSPCLTRGQLASMGVDTGRVPGMATLDSTACVPLTTLISEATTRFDVGQQRLYLTVPQAFMGNHARGYIPPELWDNGITAGLINYNFTGNNAHNTTGGSSRYAYLNLQSGLNIGAWRLRDNSTWSYSSGGSTSSNENRWQHVNSWLERDITPLRSRLTLGDSYTNGDVFDGINFRGAQLASDDNMLPDSQKGFAPEIHGIARGTAQVSIRQNGYEIYQSTVPPGPFTIDDLYAAGNGGDLQVTIKEADGSRQVFSVPWSTVPVLQREGHTRFALTAGEYRSGNSQQETPDFSRARPCMACRQAGRSTAAPSWQTAIAPLTLGWGKTWAISAPCRWISLRPTPPWLTTANIRGSRCVFSITNPWMRPAPTCSWWATATLPAAIITLPIPLTAG